MNLHQFLWIYFLQVAHINRIFFRFLAYRSILLKRICNICVFAKERLFVHYYLTRDALWSTYTCVCDRMYLLIRVHAFVFVWTRDNVSEKSAGNGSTQSRERIWKWIASLFLFEQRGLFFDFCLVSLALRPTPTCFFSFFFFIQSLVVLSLSFALTLSFSRTTLSLHPTQSRIAQARCNLFELSYENLISRAIV